MSKTETASLLAALDLARSLHPHRNLAPKEASVDDPMLHAELIGHLVAFAEERAALESEIKLCRAERSDLVAAVSHNVRTPLQVLTLAIDAVTAMGTDPRLAGTITRMKRAIATLSRHLGDLDDVSRIFDHELVLMRGAAAPAALLEEAVNVAKSRLTQPLEIVFDANPQVPSIDCDGPRVVQALVLFIDNAIRHGPRGGLISLFARTTPIGVRFEVHDVGPGPSDEVRLRLFHGLFHANAHHVGLGLTIAQGIAEAHGGTIGVDPLTSPTLGTTFYVEIPAAT